jgi:hypothetical protein
MGIDCLPMNATLLSNGAVIAKRHEPSNRFRPVTTIASMKRRSAFLTLTLLLSFWFTVSAQGTRAPEDPQMIVDWATRQIDAAYFQAGPYASKVAALIKSRHLEDKVGSCLRPVTDLSSFPFPVGDFQLSRVHPNPMLIHGTKLLVLGEPKTAVVWVVQFGRDKLQFFTGSLSDLEPRS